MQPPSPGAAATHTLSGPPPPHRRAELGPGITYLCLLPGTQLGLWGLMATTWRRAVSRLSAGAVRLATDAGVSSTASAVEPAASASSSLQPATSSLLFAGWAHATTSSGRTAMARCCQQQQPHGSPAAAAAAFRQAWGVSMHHRAYQTAAAGQQRLPPKPKRTAAELGLYVVSPRARMSCVHGEWCRPSLLLHRSQITELPDALVPLRPPPPFERVLHAPRVRVELR